MEQYQTVNSLDPITKVFLEGVYDEECVLFKLNGRCHLLRNIWRHVKDYWKTSILLNEEFEDSRVVSYINLRNPLFGEHRRLVFDRSFTGRNISFPESKGININMMPFIMGRKFEDCHLPKYLKPYWYSIVSQCIFDDEEIGTICYLTIHESDVKKSTSQRRPGIHTERPGKLELTGKRIGDTDKGQGDGMIDNETVYNHWGFGLYDWANLIIHGGIFMASNVANSCKVWDCQIVDDTCIGHLGDIEHLRSLLPESEIMEPNCLYWLTDRTPHESLMLEEKTHRQFFRLVTSQVSLWFEEHSTKNPLGVAPDPNITKIVKGSKFKKGDAYIVSDISE